MADLTFSDSNFKEEVLDSQMPVIVDFWAPWCGPCKIVSPTIDELAKEYEGKIKVGKINVDENPQAAGQYGIMSIPSIVFFKQGQPVKTMIGAQAKENYKQEIEQVLAS